MLWISVTIMLIFESHWKLRLLSNISIGKASCKSTVSRCFGKYFKKSQIFLFWMPKCLLYLWHHLFYSYRHSSSIYSHCSRITRYPNLLPRTFFNFPHSYIMGTIYICKKIWYFTGNFWKKSKFVNKEKISMNFA